MKRLALLAVALLSTAALAGALAVSWGSGYTFTDCAAAGSASQAVAGGTYLVAVTDADVWVCQAATCATGGTRLPSGSVVLVGVPFNSGSGTTFSCRSAASTGDLSFTPAN
jgi:hypothetical protein